MTQKRLKSASDLETELNSVKSKLNEQKTLIQQLEKARNYWIAQARLARNIRILSGVSTRFKMPIDGCSGIIGSPQQRRAVMMAISQLAEGPERVQPGNSYYIRIRDRTAPRDDITPYDTYIVDITLWKEEKQDGTTDSNAGE